MRRDSEVDVKKMAFVLCFFFFMSDKILFVQFFDIVLWRDTVSLMRQIFFLTRCLHFKDFSANTNSASTFLSLILTFMPWP